MTSGPRTPFTSEDDSYLVKYIATYNPENNSRSGNVLYQTLVENDENKWPWASRHTWQSWRQRYRDNQKEFDYKIRKYQEKKGIQPIAKGRKPKPLVTRERARKAVCLSPGSRTSAKEHVRKADSGTSSEEHLSEEEIDHVNVKRKAKVDDGERDRKRRRTKETGVQTKESQLQGKERDDGQGEATNEPIVIDNELGSSQQGPITAETVIGLEIRDEGSNANLKDLAATEGSELIDEEPTEKGSAELPHKTKVIPEFQTAIAKTSQLDSQVEKGSFRELVLLSQVEEASSSPIPAIAKTNAKNKSALKRRGQNPNQQAGSSGLSDHDDGKQQPGNATLHEPSSHTLQSTENATNTQKATESVPAPLYPDLAQLDDVVPQAAQKETVNTDTLPGTWPDSAPPSEDTVVKNVKARPQSKAIDVSTDKVIPRSKSHSLGNSIPSASHRLVDHHDTRPPQQQSEEITAAVAVDTEMLAVVDDSDSFFESSFSSSPPRPPTVSFANDAQTESSPAHRPVKKPRDPPRVINGAFRSALTNERSAPSKKRAPDVDSESDTDEPGKHSEPVPRAIWPPNRPAMKGQSYNGTASVPGSSPTAITHSRDSGAPPVETTAAVNMETESRRTNVHSEGPSENFLAIADGAPIAREGSVESMVDNDDSLDGPLLAKQAKPALPSLMWRHPPMHPHVQETARSSEAPSAAGSDPFLTSNAILRLNKGKRKVTLHDAHRRQTFGGFPQSPVPHIDLRTQRVHELQGTHYLRQSLGNGDAFQTGRHSLHDSIASVASWDIDFASSPPPVRRLSLSDQSLVNRLGFEAVIKSMAKNHRFAEELVREIWEDCKDFHAADELLNEMKVASERVANKSLNRYTSKDPDADVNEPRKKTSQKEQSNNVTPSAATELQWSPPANEDLERLGRDTYSPPSASRAARFKRLVGQGREEEAIRRNIRRSTGILRKGSQMQSSPQTLEISPVTEIQPLTLESDSRPPMVKIPLWTPADDLILQSGDGLALKKLEQKMGRGSVKKRMAELIRMGMV